MKIEKAVQKVSKWGSSLASVGKVLLGSRHPFPPGAIKSERLIIMGNGPSLRDVLDSELDLLKSSETMAVNFAANTPEFFIVRPSYYVLADPHFFRGADVDRNVPRLWDNLRKADWPMTLFLPIRYRGEIMKILPSGGVIAENLVLKWFNLTPGEGVSAVSHFLYNKGLAMPRPRNVLIASLMIALREGFRKIVIIGADHSWLRSLWVDDLNRVVSIQPHFYKDNEKELDRVAKEYEGYRLHDVLENMTLAFRSYHQIAGYAETLGAEIINATPESFIDAFPRGNLTS